METLSVPTKKEQLLTALTKVPIATTRQLSTLYSNNASPLKKVSQPLQELMREKLIEFFWHKRGKVWRLTRKGLLMMNGSRQKCEHIDHALEVGEIYFTLKPFQWLYEYEQRFGTDLVFNPDAVFAYTTAEGKKKPVCVEIQRTPLSEKQWKKKFSIYNEFFREAYKKSDFQKWNQSGKEIIPYVYAVTTQKNVCGLDIPNRELKVIHSVTELA